MTDNPTLDYYRQRGMLISLDLSEDEIETKMYRASGDCVCDSCGKTYYKHPFIENVLTTVGCTDPTPFLHYVCDGSIVKL